MKKIISGLFIAILLTTFVYAQKISTDKVPAAVTSAFKTKFPAVTKANWEMENSAYEANFDMKGKEMSATFDKTGKWMETEVEIKMSEMPAAVRSTLEKDYPKWKIKETSKIESVKNGKCFEAEVENGKEGYEVLFSPDGKVLNKTKMEKGKDEKD